MASLVRRLFSRYAEMREAHHAQHLDVFNDRLERAKRADQLIGSEMDIDRIDATTAERISALNVPH